ncbi:MAG: sporulation protein [Actinomycetota bacterium]
MDVQQVIDQARDLMTVGRVFGEPFEKNGVTVIPAAKVQGGGGGGDGEADGSKGPQKGSGAGFGVNARPAGAYVVDGASVEWKPAMDWNRAILGGQIVAVAALIAVASIVRSVSRSRAARG